MYYVLNTCPPGHYQFSFMATDALGHTHVRLNVVGIKDANKAQINTRQTRVIKHTNTHTHIHTHIYLSETWI